MSKEQELLSRISGIIEAAETAKKDIPSRKTFCEVLAYDHIKKILEEGNAICIHGSE